MNFAAELRRVNIVNFVDEERTKIKLDPCETVETVESSQLTFLSSSKSRDTKNEVKYQKFSPINFMYCALV